MTILLLCIIITLVLGFSVSRAIKPGLARIPDALKWLRAHGAAESWIEFRHAPSQHSIRFEKRYIAGIPGMVFVNSNKLSKVQIAGIGGLLDKFPSAVVLKEVAEEKRMGEIWFGDDIQAASDFARVVAKDVLSLGRFARYEFSFDVARHMARLLRK